jgi:hypothetical protein
MKKISETYLSQLCTKMALTISFTFCDHLHVSLHLFQHSFVFVVNVFLTNLDQVNASAFVSSNGDTQILGTSSKQDAPFSSTSRKGSSVDSLMTDPIYPGTAVERLNNVRLRVAEISKNNDLNGPWEDVRRRILWAGGLRDLSNAIPGKG